MGSSPNWSFDYTPTAAQWNYWFTQKQDDLGLNLATVTALGYGVNTTGGLVSYSLTSVAGALGYTPLKPANNLSDVASASSARSNLGLGPLAIVQSPAGALVPVNPNFGGI